MKFLADEGVDGQIVARLRLEGYDVAYIAELNVGAVDPAILKLANEDDRILITRDKDFGELAYRERLVWIFRRCCATNIGAIVPL